MIKLKQFLGGLLYALGGWLLTACTSEDRGALDLTGKGSVQLSLAAKMGFEKNTKAVDEDSYTTTYPVSDYTVKILDAAKNQVVPGCEWTYENIPTDLIELNSGSYKVIAYYGENYNKNASTREGIYMYGSTGFDINSNQVTDTEVICTPACGKLVVKFGDNMNKYFPNYSVHFHTEAAGENGSIIWTKEDTDPLYVKLNEQGESVEAIFHLTKNDGNEAEITPLIRKMSWGSMWTITVNPKVEDTTGKISISINFDDTTNDEPIDIEIPSEWLQ